MRKDLPSVALLKDIEWQTPMQIFSSDGKLISQFGEKKRIPLKLEQMPKHLINAILATEDDRFYLHFGVDPIGMSRAVLGKLMGQNKGGASTITMQVARNFFLSPEVTYTRKLREIFISFHIESLLTKDEILSLYMNKIPLGHRSFGFGAAAQVYYGKEVHELTLAQIAVLAGLPKAPSTINPIRSPKRAKERRAVVLQRMYVSGYINANEYEEARSAPITGKRHGAEIELDAPYIAEMAHQEMIGLYGKEQAYTGGYKVFTTVPDKLQRAAQYAVAKNLTEYDQRHGYRGAVKSLRPALRKSAKNQTSIDDVEPLMSEEIVTALSRASSYQNLVPAIVTKTTGQSANIQLKDLTLGNISWQGMSWAREFINAEKQGKAPKLADDILTVGDLIYVQLAENDEYILSQLPQASAALVSISPDDGAIKAAVGGFSFKQSQYNRVTQAERQVGSNIKPFIYSAALEHGFTLASIVNDAPINRWDENSGVVWRPKNSPPIYSGPIRVRLALAQSKNVIAVRLLRDVGLGNIIDHLTSFGFAPEKLPRNESIALGSASFTPLEVVTGFATFANGGFLVTPYLIDRIEDAFGNVIFQANPALACQQCDDLLARYQADDNSTTDEVNNSSNEGSTFAEIDTALTSITENNDNQKVNSFNDIEEAQIELIKAPRVISSQNAFLVTQALNTVIWGGNWPEKPAWTGTGWRARKLKRKDIAGKTGTTNSAKDAWFSGFSRRLVTTSWIGFDNPSYELGRTVYNPNLDKKSQVTGSEAGARSAQPAWITYMKSALEDYPFESFEQPENILSVRIDKVTGKLSNKNDKSSTWEFFKVGSEPTEYVTVDNSSEIIDGSEVIEEEIF
jgi:penicillin-binding protein 1A